MALSPALGFAKEPPLADPWLSLEQNLIQLHRKYTPNVPLLNPPTFTQQVQGYLDAGLWSSAEALLSRAPEPVSDEGARLKLKLNLKQGRYTEIYKTYQGNRALFQGYPDLILGASQGALKKRAYQAALSLLNQLHFPGQERPEQYYFSALAYWGLQENKKLEDVLAQALVWAEGGSESVWVSRIHLLKVYYHLNQKEYDLAFASMGNLFDNNTDLALLALTWGYFKLGATNNLFSILQALDVSEEQSPYHSQIYRILSRFLIEEGNLRGAIEMDQKERDELKKQMKILEEETAMLRRGISISSHSIPPASLLLETLSKLKKEVGEKRGITTLSWYIDLQQRRQILSKLKEREREIDREQRRLQMEMVRRCLSLKRHELRLTGDFSFPHPDESAQHPTEHFPKKEYPVKVREIYEKARQTMLEKNIGQTIRYLETIFALAPHQPYGLESAFRLGEIAFNQRDYGKAAAYYQDLVDRPDSPLQHLALYKQAWAFYLDQKPLEAISTLIKQEVDFRDELQEKREGPCVSVRTPQERREPFRLLALALDKIGGPGELIYQVNKIDPIDRYNFYVKVAKHYQGEDKVDDMFQLIRSWITAYPYDLKTPLLHEKMVRLIKQSESVPMENVVRARTEFVNTYRPDSLWGSAHKVSDRNGVKPLLKTHLRFLMTHYYSEAKKTGTENLYQSVLTWYADYLSIFPEEDDIGKDRFIYAEALTQLKENNKALLAYRKSAYSDPLHSMAAEAAYQEVLLLEKHALEGPEIEAAYERFASRFPSDDRTKEIAMRLAEFAFQRGDYEKSRFYAKKVSPEFHNKTASREIDLAAYRLVAQGFLKEQSYLEAIHFINDLLTGNKNLGLEKIMSPMRVLAYFQQGELLKRQGEDQEAAKAFWQAYRFGAENEMGPLSLFEAAVLWAQPPTQEKSETAFHLFSALYSKSTLHHPALIRLAVLYQETERPFKSAETYEKAAQLPINKTLATKALEQAIALYEISESWEKVSLLAMKRAKTLKAGQKTDGRSRWMLMAAEANIKIGRGVTANRILSQIVHETRPEDTVSQYAAKAHFILAESKRNDYEEIKLVAPLEENLQKKRTLFDQLLENYDTAMAHPSPILALHANYRIGELFETFSRALLESERPEDLSFDEEELYENLLIEQALPYIEKAEEVYQQNIDVGRETGMANEWISKSERHLFMLEQQLDLFNRGEQEVLG